MDTVERILRLLGWSDYVQPAINTFVVALGAVYVFGRMLRIVTTSRGRNIVAFTAILISAVIYTVDSIWNIIPIQVKSVLFVIGAACVLYTLVGFRLFVRVNAAQDKVIGDDNIEDKPEDYEPNPTTKKKVKQFRRNPAPTKIPLMKS